MNREYAHYKNFPKAKWRWSDFTPRELRSKSDNRLMIDPDSMDKLQALRTLIGKPMRVTSAYRSAAHNEKVGGVPSSEHLKAKAYDIQMEGHDPAQFEAAGREVGFTGFGFYEKQGFIHIDTGRAREWGDRWFDKAAYWMGNVPQPDMAEVEADFDNVTFIDEPAKPASKPGLLFGVIGGVAVAAVAGAAKFLDWLNKTLEGLF